MTGWWRPAAVLAVGLAAYHNSFGGQFYLDDGPVLDDFLVRDPATAWPHYLTFQTTRQVSLATLAANRAVGGMDPWGYHAVNLAVHLAAALALYGLVRRALAQPGVPGRWAAAGPNLAVVSAAVWAAHPLATQAVTYVVQRMEALMAVGYLASLYALSRGAAGGGRRWYAAAVAAGWVSAGAKEVAVTLPLVALLYDRAFLGGRAWGRRWVYAGLAAGWVLFLPAFGLVRADGGAGGSAGFGAGGVTWREYARTQAGVVLHYLRLAAWPTGQCFDARWPIAHDPADWVPHTAAVAALACASLWAAWRFPRVGFLPAAFFLVLAPTSSVVPIADPMVEHRMYLPLAAVVVLGVAAADAGLSRLGAGAAVKGGLAAAVVAALGWQTVRRNDVYRDPVAMWSDVLAARPTSLRAHGLLADALMAAGRPADAEAHYRWVLAFDPAADPGAEYDDRHKAFAWHGIGRTLAARGRPAEALECYERAVALFPVGGRYIQAVQAARRAAGR